MKGWKVASLALYLCLTGCDQQQQGQNQNDLRITKLEKEVSDLQSQLAAAQKTLQTQQFLNKFVSWQISSLTDDTAFVDTDTKDFGVARTVYGPFIVSTQQVVPYLDGYKVTLQMGNLTSATFSDAKVTITWGPNGFGQQKEFQVPNNFLPGRYTQFEFALTPAKPEDVKRIQVGLTFGALSLGLPINQ